MDEVDPLSLLLGLKTMVQPAIAMLYTHRRRLLPVFLGIYLLNLALTALLGNLASPVINLDSMGLMYEIYDNSTEVSVNAVVVATSGAIEDEETEFSPLWKLHLIGAFFGCLSSLATVLTFSKVFREGRSQANMTWRKWYGLAHAIFTCSVLEEFLCEILEANELDFLDDLIYFNRCVFVFTVIVVTEEGLYGVRAIQKACRLVGRRLKDIPGLVVTIVSMENVLEYFYNIAFFQGPKEEGGPPVIREDTTAEIWKFSAVAACVALIQYSLGWAVFLSYYKRHRQL